MLAQNIKDKHIIERKGSAHPYRKYTGWKPWPQAHLHRLKIYLREGCALNEEVA